VIWSKPEFKLRATIRLLLRRRRASEISDALGNQTYALRRMADEDEGYRMSRKYSRPSVRISASSSLRL
jgi:hypothetical protein